MTMSSSQISLPENEDITEDISIPTLSNRFRLLVVPQKARGSLFNKSYRTRGSGKLKGFMGLPMDIVFETAMYLAPKDVLELSRLSKQFRSIFASRSAIFVWRTVFRNVNLKCVEDLNEIQFASLLYDKCCMACGRITKSCSVFPILRLRLCPNCRTANFITLDDLRIQYPNAWDIICNLPTSWAGCFKPEAQLLIEKFLSLKRGNSLKFIVNMQQHNEARREASTSILHIASNIRTTGRVRTKIQACRRSQ